MGIPIYPHFSPGLCSSCGRGAFPSTHVFHWGLVCSFGTFTGLTPPKTRRHGALPKSATKPLSRCPLFRCQPYENLRRGTFSTEINGIQIRTEAAVPPPRPLQCRSAASLPQLSGHGHPRKLSFITIRLKAGGFYPCF